MAEELPMDIRPRAFAGVELFLDLVYIIQSFTELDLESTIIYVCVAEATMRPVVLNATDGEAMRRAVTPPEDQRGAISRLLIADRTGLSRETVRRRTNDLIRRGLLYEAATGGVRVYPALADDRQQKTVNEIFDAVQRYMNRLRQLGAETPNT